jgi:ABC-type Co2+ transport system permease subunit
MIDYTMKQPSTFVPVTLSLAAVVVLVGHAIIYGVAHEGDQGIADHLVQIFMTAQIPVVIFLIVTRLRREPRQTMEVLAVQAVAALAAFTAIFFLE